MRQRSVGASGLRVSRLGLGTLTWGRDVSAATAEQLLTTFVEAGGSLLDTAGAYGNGDAETMIGDMLGRVVDRDDLVLATKAGFGVRDGERVVDTSRRALLRDLDASLRRLRVDHVDLWQVHAWGEAPIEETLAALDMAVSSGRVGYVGVSNYVGWQTAQAATWQRAVPGRCPVVSTQVEYSLLARRAEIEVLPAVRAFEMGFFPWSPLGRGVLTGKYRTGTPRDSRAASEHFAWFVEPYLEPRSRAVVEAVARAAEGLDLTPLQVALLWVRDAPSVTAPLLGARTVSQLKACLSTEPLDLPEEIARALDDVSGGPLPARDLDGPGPPGPSAR
ncbi:aldo/keto reductase [Desertihabitans aurantiacus]|uniref:aldo/keto reductase n=1 Tax=Desertihabitans aurantiacus TaxID=2282477 RepID=UPI000DF7422A|nr:aldo/keto reductase [Desertihabitans aurantiacus]